MTPARRRFAAASVLAVAIALALPLILWAGGVSLPGTQPARSTDPVYPPFMNGTAPGTMRKPSTCDNCHSEYSAGLKYEPWDTWAGSMMGNAARDPMFWAALDIANQDDAALGGPGVGDLCIRCHVPYGWYEGRSKCTTPWGEEFDGKCLTGSPTEDIAQSDFDGVMCHFCHRMYDASTPPAGQFADAAAPYAGNAQVYLSTVEAVMRGPFTDATPPGAIHQAAGQAFNLSGSFCGQCHDVTNPVKNRRDSVTGADLGYRMPIERTYSEWRQSRYSDASAAEHRTCQECHMPKPDIDGDGLPDDGYACALATEPRGDATPLQGPMRQHVFAGANTWMLSLLKGEYATLFSTDRTLQYDTGIGATQRVLATAVALGLTAPPTIAAGDSVAVTARVTNLGGHKFPTGYPEGRRAWIGVVGGEDVDGDGTLSAGEIQFESAAYDASTGDLTLDAQAKTYEVHLGVFDHDGTGQCDTVDAAGKPMFHFVLNDCVVKDDRIPPLGFVPNGETAPVAYTYPANPALPGTLANWDDTPYVVPVPEATTRNFIVEARVRYQTTSREYVEFLRDESVSTCDPFDATCNPTVADSRRNRGEKMHDLWQAYGRAAPTDLAFARAIVAVTPPVPGACCVLGACSELTAGACHALEGEFLGSGTTCATTPCSRPGLPPGEAGDVLAGHAPLLVTYDRDGTVSLAFGLACDATDHEVAWGALSAVGSYPHSGLECGIGVTGTATITPGPGSFYFLVVGRSTVAEGSYGSDSRGTERPQRVGTTSCDLPQDLSATCR